MLQLLAQCSPQKQCQQHADVIYYSGHGDHSTGKLYGVALPSDVATHWRDIETVVFAGCSVLDIGDRENHYSDPSKHSANPGLLWIPASGANVLLGYAYKAPRDSQGGDQIVADWCANRTAMGDVAAWMKSNDRRSGRNACAIRILPSGKIEYRYFRKVGRSWGRNRYTEITEELEP